MALLGPGHLPGSADSLLVKNKKYHQHNVKRADRAKRIPESMVSLYMTTCYDVTEIPYFDYVATTESFAWQLSKLTNDGHKM